MIKLAMNTLHLMKTMSIPFVFNICTFILSENLQTCTILSIGNYS